MLRSAQDDRSRLSLMRRPGFLFGNLAVQVDLDSTNVRRPNRTRERAAAVGSERMALMQHRVVHDNGRVWVPDDDVGVESGREAPLVTLQTGKSRRRDGHPFAYLCHRQATFPRPVPHCRQT